MKYKLILAYDGTNYSGWQVQPNATSIQEIIEKAICTIVKDDIRLIGSGRTDAGVHALGQVAHFRTDAELNLSIFFKSLNGMLPFDIRLLDVSKVDDSFHAQKSATSKIYHYHIVTDPVIIPFKRLYALHTRKKLDVELLRKAASYFVGEHNFASFANAPEEGAAKKNPIRTIYRLDVCDTPDGFRLEFEGSGFLYKMVRNITGMLLDVASGKRPFSDIQKVLHAKDRRLASPPAIPNGLFLVTVQYT